MEPEQNKKEAEIPVEASTEPESNMKKQLDNKNKSETLAEASTKPNSNKKGLETPAEASTRSDSSRKNTPKSLKSKTKIEKKWKQGKKNKHVFKGNKESTNNEEDVKKLKAREEETEKNIINEECKDERIIQLEKHKQKQRNKRRRGGSDSSLKNQSNKEKHDGMEKSHHNEKKEEKLGGLIFMCNSKTKPDCFRYRVMGVPTSKKDVVMDVKPGLTIFLYDFDLKLLYGIYKASSNGGMKLEPRAFGGAFPVQVRFGIKKDCLPLPESIFKKAIKENYNEKNKFKTELTVKQVRKLTELFRPAEVRSNMLPIHSPQVPRVRDREVHERVRETLPHSHMETLARDPYTKGDSVSYPFLSHERDHQHIAYQDMTTIQREEIPRERYLTEKEYRAFGLQGERINLTPPSHIAPTMETYQRDYEREHLLRQPDHMYRDAISAHRETIHADPLYLNEKEYQTYGLVARQEFPPSAVPVATATSATALGSYTKDPYYAYHYGASSGDPYNPNLRQEVPSGSYPVGRTYPIEMAHLRRTERDQAEGLYSTYAANAPPPYNRTQHYQGTQPEAGTVPVSSRYSFACLSLPPQ
ncbi:uncharacterized protein LOC132170299 [Corylus avellana]|uniref:uncharacterized protein LOC132170299 n=1 Tax=Corylus avellana TaxID=13451 RepID=UPI00286D6544|nr:uncharacterized protein LOC132170299 [Corylus avellana]